MTKFLFKFQSVKKTSIEENLDYYKRLSMDLDKLEDNAFFFYQISGFLKKIGLNQYNADNCLFSKYKK
jgi:hypothetical protein